jgi:serine/threonine protein kinase
VPVYAFGDDGGNWYIAMRLIEGGSLADWIQRETADGSRPADPRQAATILRKLAEATHHAHQHGVLHRDLKPENVLIDAAGRPLRHVLLRQLGASLGRHHRANDRP